MNIPDSVFLFINTPSLGFLLGGLIAAGMLVGGAFALSRFSHRDVVIFVLAVIMYLAFLEGVRFEIMHNIGQDYSSLPIVSILVTFSSYVGGIIVGWCLTKPKGRDPLTLTHDDLMRIAEERLLERHTAE